MAADILSSDVWSWGSFGLLLPRKYNIVCTLCAEWGLKFWACQRKSGSRTHWSSNPLWLTMWFTVDGNTIEEFSHDALRLLTQWIFRGGLRHGVYSRIKLDILELKQGIDTRLLLRELGCLSLCMCSNLQDSIIAIVCRYNVRCPAIGEGTVECVWGVLDPHTDMCKIYSNIDTLPMSSTSMCQRSLLSSVAPSVYMGHHGSIIIDWWLELSYVWLFTALTFRWWYSDGSISRSSWTLLREKVLAARSGSI